MPFFYLCMRVVLYGGGIAVLRYNAALIDLFARA
jgi:hypothetical protein